MKTITDVLGAAAEPMRLRDAGQRRRSKKRPGARGRLLSSRSSSKNEDERGIEEMIAVEAALGATGDELTLHNVSRLD